MGPGPCPPAVGVWGDNGGVNISEVGRKVGGEGGKGRIKGGS